MISHMWKFCKLSCKYCNNTEQKSDENTETPMINIDESSEEGESAMFKKTGPLKYYTCKKMFHYSKALLFHYSSLLQSHTCQHQVSVLKILHQRVISIIVRGYLDEIMG